MSAVSTALLPAETPVASSRIPPGDRVGDRPRRWGWGLALGLVLVGSLALRLWGIKQGLPYAYNTDENNHFVRQAIAFSNHDLNPHYFSNPPAFTYLLHVVFAVWFGARAALSRAFAHNPTEVFMVARVTAAVLGTLAVWLLYVTGKRLVDRRVGLLAAALMGVAFLPVFYAHLALNDAPTLAPLTLSLLGSAGVLRMGRPLDYVIAGAGLGLACATKYTGGIVLVPLVAAAATQYLAPGGQRSAVIGLVLAGVSAVALFLVANPYSIIDYETFRSGLAHQSTVAGDSTGKLGLTHRNGALFYLETMTWALGWVPALAALGGALALWRDEPRLVGVLVPAPVLFLIFMGLQGRYFGRWLMPILPFLCLLAAYAVLELAEWGGRRRPALRPTLITLAVVALCAQGLVHSIHAGLILSRADTRNEARAWLVAHIPLGTKIVVEPVVPDEWVQDPGRPSPLTDNGNRWVKFFTSRSNIASDGSLTIGAGTIVNIEDYERTLRPDLIPAYEQAGYCWIVSGSTQSGRAAAAPRQVPGAIAYYTALDRSATVAYRATPFSGRETVPFDFDFTFDYYPLAYHRPGPLMTVYHLTDGACAGS